MKRQRHYKLQQLCDDNPRNEAVPAVRIEAAADGEAHIYVYGVIDEYYGAGATDLVIALLEAGDQKVHLHINSPGGDVFEARAMASALVAHPADVVSHIDGMAASAATYLALAANEVRMTDGGLFMIHNAWTFAMGDKTDLRSVANLLEKIDGQLYTDYAKRTGASVDQVKAWMDATTWFTPQEALDAKFIDAVDPNTKREASAQAAALAALWNLSAYGKPTRRDKQESVDRSADEIAATALAEAAAAEVIEKAAAANRQMRANRARVLSLPTS